MATANGNQLGIIGGLVMKVGDLIDWHGFLGIIVDPHVEHTCFGWVMRIVWADGGISIMCEDEVKLYESR